MIVGLVGCGNMGSALVKGWLSDKGLALRIFDKAPARAQALTAQHDQARVVEQLTEVLEAEVIVLAVKPPGIVPTLELLTDALPAESGEKLFVSIAAGVEVEALQAVAPLARVVRTMPNVGAALGVGTTAVAMGRHCDEQDQRRVRALFAPTGAVVFTSAEAEMHGATALAGSGPAFFLALLEAMIDGGVAAGLARPAAEAYARGALRAAAHLADGGDPPAVIRARITSPGGTTIAGLNALEHAGGRSAMLASVEAAVDRSEEMSSLK